MPTSALATTPLSQQPQDCPQTEQIAREWAVTFAELYSVSLKDRGPRFVALWVSALADLPANVLNVACQNAMKTCKFFPTPAEIRTLVNHAGKEAEELAAEQAWDFALNFSLNHYHPDIGVYRNTPAIPPKTEHAIRAAGGLRWLSTCPDDQTPWVKKAFIAAYENINELERTHELLPSGSEAKEILRQWAEQAENLHILKPAPTACAVAEPERPKPQEVHAEFAALQLKLDAPKSLPEPLSEEEWNRQRDLRRARFQIYLQEHPELGAA